MGINEAHVPKLATGFGTIQGVSTQLRPAEGLSATRAAGFPVAAEHAPVAGPTAERVGNRIHRSPPRIRASVHPAAYVGADCAVSIIGTCHGTSRPPLSTAPSQYGVRSSVESDPGSKAWHGCSTRLRSRRRWAVRRTGSAGGSSSALMGFLPPVSPRIERSRSMPQTETQTAPAAPSADSSTSKTTESSPRTEAGPSVFAGSSPPVRTAQGFRRREPSRHAA